MCDYAELSCDCKGEVFSITSCGGKVQVMNHLLEWSDLQKNLNLNDKK